MKTRLAAVAARVVVWGAALACLAAAAGPAAARPKHHHRHAVTRAARLVPVAAVPPGEAPYSFYPNEIDGGVSGNLPFNNQLRKLKDPLNANGAGR